MWRFTMFLCLLPVTVQAAPSMTSEVCALSGRVISVSPRVEERSDLHGGVLVNRYLDVVMAVETAEVIEPGPLPLCHVAGSQQTYQLKNGQDAPRSGDCIRGENHFFADDFGAASWLDKVESSSACGSGAEE
jgi:hypothetical protein